MGTAGPLNRDSGISGMESGRGYGHGTSANTGSGMNSRGLINGGYDGKYASGANDMDMSRGYDNARSNSSTIPVPVSDVGRDSVLHASSGVKESNSNLAPYMIDRGVGSYGGANPGTDYGTGSGTRTYAATRESNSPSQYTHNVNVDSSRFGPSEHRAGGIHATSNSGDKLSYSRDTASELGLFPSSNGNNRSQLTNIDAQYSGSSDHAAREDGRSTTQKMADTASNAASYVGDTATNAASYTGDTAMRAGSYIADTASSAVSAIKPMETASNAASFVGDTAASAGSFMADTVSTMKPMEKASNAASYIGDTASAAASYAGDTAVNAGSYMADTARSNALPAGPSSNLRAETSSGVYDRTYSPGDVSGHDTRLHDTSDTASITQKIAGAASDATSLVADTAKDVASSIGITSSASAEKSPASDAVPRGYNIGTGLGFGSGINYSPRQARTRGMPGSFDESYSTSYNPMRIDGGGPRRASSVIYRGGAYISGHDSHDDTTGRAQEMARNTNRSGEDTIGIGSRMDQEIHDRDREGNNQRDHERATRECMQRDMERMERERIERERKDRERTDPNYMGVGARGSSGGRYVITRGGDAAMLDSGSQGASTIPRSYGAGTVEGNVLRDDANSKAERLREELEQELRDTQAEALRIARAGHTGGPSVTTQPQKIASPGQNNSSLVAQDHGPLDTKNSEPGHIPSAFSDNYPQSNNLEQQMTEREMESERSVRRSSMDRHRATDTSHGLGPGGMMTTMRNEPEYRDQKLDDTGSMVTDERQREQSLREKVESQFEGYDDEDEVRRKSLLGRAASKMGNLLKA